MLLTIDHGGPKITRNIIFNSHLSPVGQQMAIENSVSKDFWSTFFNSIYIFDCPLFMFLISWLIWDYFIWYIFNVQYKKILHLPHLFFILLLDLWISYVISVLLLLCFCARLFIDALWSPAGKGPTSWLSFVMSNCEVVTFPLVSWVRCSAWLYRFLIFALFLTLIWSWVYLNAVDVPGIGVGIMWLEFPIPNLYRIKKWVSSGKITITHCRPTQGTLHCGRARLHALIVSTDGMHSF